MITVEPADPVRIVKDWLTTELAVPFPTATVSLVMPTEWELGVTPPAVVLFDDSGPENWPVMTRPTIRCTVWATNRDDSRAIAARCKALLQGKRIPGVKVPSGTGLAETVDSKLGAIITTFTVSTRVRTVAI
jgi:hypothetical protein